jgi:hypothetical protein
MIGNLKFQQHILIPKIIAKSLVNLIINEKYPCLRKNKK